MMDQVRGYSATTDGFALFETNEVDCAKLEFELVEALNENKNQIKILKCHLIFENSKVKLLQNLAKLLENKHQRLVKKSDQLQVKVQVLQTKLEKKRNKIELIKDNIFTEYLSQREMDENLDVAFEKNRKIKSALNAANERLDEQKQVKIMLSSVIISLENLCFGQSISIPVAVPAVLPDQAIKTDVDLEFITAMRTGSLENPALEAVLKKKNAESKLLISNLKSEWETVAAEVAVMKKSVENQSDTYMQKMKEYRASEKRHNRLALEWETEVKTNKSNVMQIIEDEYTFNNPEYENTFFGEELSNKWEKTQELKEKTSQDCDAHKEKIKTGASEITAQALAIEKWEERLTAMTAQSLKQIEERQAAFTAKCESLQSKKIIYLDLYRQSTENLEAINS